MTTQIFLTFAVSSLWLQVQCEGVTQHPAVAWSHASRSAEMNCSHDKDITYTQMYWYRQRPGETMQLVVYTVYGGQPDYAGAQNKYSAVKDSIETGALTVKELTPEDSGVYFCAVSKHSDVRRASLGVKVDQTPPDLISRPGDRVQLVCSHGKTDYTLMSWYQKSPGDRALKRIGHVYYSTKDYEESFREHFTMTGDMSGDTAKNGSLVINKLEAPKHTAVYYCAASYAHLNTCPVLGSKTLNLSSSTFVAFNLSSDRRIAARCERLIWQLRQ